MSAPKVRLFEVGGCVRDELLGVKSKDIDFAVEAESFDALRQFLAQEGFKVFLESPEFTTIRAQFPRTSARRGLVADFVLCRKDGPSTDGRRPDFVEPGTLLDDLSRRDFTVNAMARAEDGSLIDPFGGQFDLEAGILRTVGKPADRMREDGLRIFRALRFAVTKDFRFSMALENFLFFSDEPAKLIGGVSKERIREELTKAFRADSLHTFTLLSRMGEQFLGEVFKDGLRLDATLKD